MVLGIVLVLPASSLLAQHFYTLQNLIDSASQNLPLLKQKQALVSSSLASVTDVRHSFLPQVKFSEQLNLGSNNSMAGTYFTFGITPSTSAGVRDANNLDPVTGNVAVLYSEYELANFGLNNAKLNYSLSNADFQRADLQRDQYSLQLDIAKRYFNILRNQYRLDADKQNIDRYTSIFTVIRALTASGVIAGADSSLAKAELAKAHINYNQTHGKINQLKEELSYLTGIPSLQIYLDTLFNNFIRSKPVASNFLFDTLNNPLLNYFEKKKNIVQVNEALIRKSFLPKIILAGSLWARGSSIQYNDNFKSLPSGLGYQRVNYAVGIAFYLQSF